MRFEFSEITQVSVIFFKSLSQEISAQDEKVRFFKEYELKVTLTFRVFNFTLWKYGSESII